MSKPEDSLATLPPLSEKDFLAQVVQLAEIRGWQWLHLRPGMTRDSWRTPISGPLGKGWPDLVLVRVKDHRMLFVELKSEGGKLSQDQGEVLNLLERTLVDHERRILVKAWWPAHWPEIEETLR